MTRFSFAELGKWGEIQGRKMDYVVEQSTNDVIVQASKTATGVTRGGSLQRGYVPRAKGILAASLVSTLQGSTAITQGDGDFSLVVGAMEAGDIAEFAWTAPYAKAMHYGSRGRQGWHWVTEAANNWQAIVAGNIQKAQVVR